MVGITFIAGSSLGSVVIERNVWKQLKDAPYRASSLLSILIRLPLMMFVGSLLMLLSGLLMLGTSDWVMVTEGWFIAKSILYVLLNLNGYLIAKPAVARLTSVYPGLFETDPSLNSDLASIKNRMRFFHYFNFIILMALYGLSIFK